MKAKDRSRRIAAVRHFNRFYTSRIGVLGRSLLDSDFSLTESRVLYELAQGPGVTARAIVRRTGLDPGYLSRILKSFRDRALVTAAIGRRDRRERPIHLTSRGHRAFAALDRASRRQVAAMLAPLAEPTQDRVLAAMRMIESALAPEPQPPRGIALRPHRVGDLAWVAHRQALLYANEYGWDGSFEALVCDIAARFVRRFDPRHDMARIAERDGAILGAVFVVRRSRHVAQLRMLYVEAEARGSGLGRRLVDEAIAFARKSGYRRLTLWTNDVLDSARRIYQAAGFVLGRQERYRGFGKTLVGQFWDLRL
ncbi:MAG: MarR family transcriptional regulator [Alphaproteobacteria bacterium]|nr:MarR family transcriptional regulator [Alphaproteobacteria bacterium]